MAELRCQGSRSRTATSGSHRRRPRRPARERSRRSSGASGSGKTTLLRLVIGFIAADRGASPSAGASSPKRAACTSPPDKRAIGYVAQEGALFPHLTVAENVALRPAPRRAEGQPRIGEMLELVGLDRELRERGSPTSSPAASSGASRSRGRSRRGRGSCCSTSRSRGSTPRSAPRRARRSSSASPGRGRRPCS